jgi:hypothetical protein
MPREYVNYLICKEFGWNYKDLMEQPRFFIEEMIQIMGISKKMEKRIYGRR